MAEEILSTRLVHIDQHIAQTEQRVRDQAELIERLDANGCDISNSFELLCTFQETVRVLKYYRRNLEGLIYVRQEMRKVL